MSAKGLRAQKPGPRRATARRQPIARTPILPIALARQRPSTSLRLSPVFSLIVLGYRLRPLFAEILPFLVRFAIVLGVPSATMYSRTISKPVFQPFAYFAYVL